MNVHVAVVDSSVSEEHTDSVFRKEAKVEELVFSCYDMHNRLYIYIYIYIYTHTHYEGKFKERGLTLRISKFAENSRLGRHNTSEPIVQAETKIISLAHLYDNVGTSLVMQNSATQSLQIIHEFYVLSLQ